VATRIVLLGTAGGPTPKRTRSAPANAVLVDESLYVVDCGSGVARQITLAGLDIRALRAMFVTHHHSDHNVDAGALIQLAWAAGFDKGVDVLGPPPLRNMMSGFRRFADVDIRTRIEDEGRPDIDALVRIHEIAKPGLVYRDARVMVHAALVEHPPLVPAFAFRFDTPDRSVVFSGDTTPCKALIDLASGADVLVHEVLYEGGVAEILGRLKNATRLREHLSASHTRLEDVGTVATRAGVRTLVLNHLIPSDGIDDEVWRNGAAQGFAGEIIVGSDLMEI